ncbi:MULTISPECIES: AraC family transcriptional regulator [unclassified Paenibacillus]|uniref:AraC family transcriptional regulator n=1 Tax=unclassified Paenibacillus TaxID=185978 RepID=UPI000838489B|nr:MULTISPECIES: AraC family transcriptional regulator [unclassified Paenibacillus]NWL89707.1 AraC family transcriptional regulator [Paenibacillus sp. 79R4]
MSQIIEITAPPLPQYIISGSTHMSYGGKHLSRKNIGVFDLLVVSQGCLYVGEEKQNYEVSAGHALILRPDCYHFGFSGCQEETVHHWLHFQVSGNWRVIELSEYCKQHLAQEGEDGAYMSLHPFTTTPFTLAVPQFTYLPQLQKMIDTIDELTEMNRASHHSSVRLKQQALFQDVIGLLAASLETAAPSPGSVCAEKAAAYLREHFREPFSAKKLGESINFHPVYIARCMQKVFGCSPAAYMLLIRIEHSKLLLVQTDMPIERIAEEVGFNHAAYFTACFTKQEGLSPRRFRQHFAWNRES